MGNPLRLEPRKNWNPVRSMTFLALAAQVIELSPVPAKDRL